MHGQISVWPKVTSLCVFTDSFAIGSFFLRRNQPRYILNSFCDRWMNKVIFHLSLRLHSIILIQNRAPPLNFDHGNTEIYILNRTVSWIAVFFTNGLHDLQILHLGSVSYVVNCGHTSAERIGPVERWSMLSCFTVTL